MPGTERDDRLRQAARTRGTVTILCKGEKAEIAAAARAVGAELGLEPRLDRAPADAVRVGFRPEGREGQPPLA